jgi:hypothetical protein
MGNYYLGVSKIWGYIPSYNVWGWLMKLLNKYYCLSILGILKPERYLNY